MNLLYSAYLYTDFRTLRTFHAFLYIEISHKKNFSLFIEKLSKNYVTHK